MFEVIISNVGFWFVLLTPVLIGLYFLITHREYSAKEFFLQTLATIVFSSLAYVVLFETDSNTDDFCYNNYLVTQYEYVEPWEELVHYTVQHCSGSGKTRTCWTEYKTRIDHHSADYNAILNNGNIINSSKENFEMANKNYGSTFQKRHQSGRISSSGDAYISSIGVPVPYVSKVSVTNWVLGAKYSILNKNSEVNASKFPLYPEIVGSADYFAATEQGSKYDPLQKYISQDINRTIGYEGSDRDEIRMKLDTLAGQYGVSKKINPLVVVTD